jgi:hypothetical protein
MESSRFGVAARPAFSQDANRVRRRQGRDLRRYRTGLGRTPRCWGCRHGNWALGEGPRPVAGRAHLACRVPACAHSPTRCLRRRRVDQYSPPRVLERPRVPTRLPTWRACPRRPGLRANFAQWRNLRIIAGAVPESLGHLDARAIAFLNIDMNCAAPEVDALCFFWPRLFPVVRLDDYAFLRDFLVGPRLSALERTPHKCDRGISHQLR